MFKNHLTGHLRNFCPAFLGEKLEWDSFRKIAFMTIFVISPRSSHKCDPLEFQAENKKTIIKTTAICADCKIIWRLKGGSIQRKCEREVPK